MTLPSRLPPLLNSLLSDLINVVQRMDNDCTAVNVMLLHLLKEMTNVRRGLYSRFAFSVIAIF